MGNYAMEKSNLAGAAFYKRTGDIREQAFKGDDGKAAAGTNIEDAAAVSAKLLYIGCQTQGIYKMCGFDKGEIACGNKAQRVVPTPQENRVLFDK